MSTALRALVAGGSGALGSSVCKVLLEKGYEVHATATSGDTDINATPGFEDVRVHVADLTDEMEAERLFKEVGAPLHALVSTVGGYRGGALAEVTQADIRHLVDLNLTTTLVILKSAYPYLRQTPGGAGVVLTAARGAVDGGPGSALYAATKAAVANLASSAAQEWLEEDISVNAILPSTMDTEANRDAMPNADHSRWPSTAQVAEVAAFLVSAAARIVSGGAIPVYGKA
jgi:NAD(P)-dependent dehydrogenase (short-subunit alcohol dehydrogenase family)